MTKPCIHACMQCIIYSYYIILKLCACMLILYALMHTSGPNGLVGVNRQSATPLTIKPLLYKGVHG